MRAVAGFVICFLELLSCTHTQAAADGDEDVLLRSPAQWEVMEKIYREAVDTRTIEATHDGTFDATATLGFRPQVSSTHCQPNKRIT